MNRHPDILLVEDNPGDVRLVREALAESGATSRLHTVGDGAEALAFVRRQGPYADAPRPDLILLDLNLPRVDGRQVLAELASSDTLRHIPVVVLTTSARDEDVAACRDQARAFITKPDDLDAYIDVLRWIDQLARARGRVLVVDGDRDQRDRLEQQLIDHGFEVATTDADAAPATAGAFTPDVILVIDGMPAVDGLERVLTITRGEPLMALAGRIRQQISLHRALGPGR